MAEVTETSPDVLSFSALDEPTQQLVDQVQATKCPLVIARNGKAAAVLVEAYKLPPQEALYFASELFVYLTSCDERRLGQWDYVSWKDFIREDRMSAEYRTVASRSLVRNLAATVAAHCT